MSSFDEIMKNADMITSAYLEMQSLMKEIAQLNITVDELRSQQLNLKEKIQQTLVMKTLKDAFSFV